MVKLVASYQWSVVGFWEGEEGQLGDENRVGFEEEREGKMLKFWERCYIKRGRLGSVAP